MPIEPGRLGLWVPAEPDAALEALDEATFRATDERMPYYATLWPAGESLAARVLAAGDLGGRRVLDLGSGVAATGLAALAVGGRVTCLDWEPRAHDLVRRSARDQGLPAPEVVTADWRRVEGLGAFDLVLASDVLYEVRNVDPVARFLAAHLAPEGEAWVADPGRAHADRFPAAARAHGLAVVAAEPLPARAHGVRVVCWVLRRAAEVA